MNALVRYRVGELVDKLSMMDRSDEVIVECVTDPGRQGVVKNSSLVLEVLDVRRGLKPHTRIGNSVIIKAAYVE